MKIWLIRHGRTQLNQQGLIQGWIDAPLNHDGRLQAECVANTCRELDIDAIFSSDLIRARQTAQAIAKVICVPVMYTWLLRERSYGELEMRSKHDVCWTEIDSGGPEYDLLGVETRQKLKQRLIAFLHSLSSFPRPLRRIVVITHAGVMNEFCHLVDPHHRWRRFHNTAIHELTYLENY